MNYKIIDGKVHNYYTFCTLKKKGNGTSTNNINLYKGIIIL